MGVPGFFLWLTKKYKKNVFINQINFYKNKNFKWLCLDANGLCHPKSFEVLAENPDFKNLDSLENKMISRYIEYIERLVSLVKPTEGLYIAIDGVAPIAKIKQQRQRRFKSVNEREVFDKLKDKYNVPKSKFWNNSCITPGTDYMEKITNKLKHWSSQQDYKIIFSSAKTPGEGEHKIINFIRKRNKENKQGPYVIYGLDADLIFLGLALDRNDVFLMREANQINNKASDILTLVDLEEMKKLVVDTMLENLDSVKPPTNTELIHDFIFMCYFLGNDFLPHNPTLDVYNKGLDKLLECYKETIEITYEPLLNVDKNNVKINQKTLFEFIKCLANKEEDILKDLHMAKKRKPPLSGSDYEKAVQKVETLRFRVNDPIELGKDEFEKYSERYYNHYFSDCSEENITKICYEYVKGLVWVSDYYFKECSSWDYYYPYSHSPFIKDLLKIVSLLDLSKIKFKMGKPLKPLEQLLIVLPPQSKFLVPKKIQGLFNENSELGHLYPNSFQQDFLHKNKYWQGIPLLPYLEIDLVKKVFSKYEGKLDKKDKDKMKIEKDFVYNNDK